MRFIDILAVVDSQGADTSVVAFAGQLAQKFAGRPSALAVGWMPSVPFAVEGWVIDPMWGDLVTRAETELRKAAEGVARGVLPLGGAVESQLLELGAARPVVSARARYADIAIVARPTTRDSETAHALLEGALFGSGRPVAVVPPGWRPAPIGRSIVVAWKPTRESARALGEADDLLPRAEHVSVVVVDAKPNEGGYGDDPGVDVIRHLRRRGVTATLTTLSSGGRSEGQAIHDHAKMVGADLIVMGGYGRARTSEFIFGGVTHDLTRTSSVPLLLAH